MNFAIKSRVTKSALVTVSLVIVLVAVIWYLGKEISRREREIVDHRVDLASRGQMLALLSGLKQDATRARQVLPELREALPEQEDLVSFPRELEAIANTEGVEFAFTFGNEAPATEDSPAFIRFTISLAGSMDALRLFFERLEQHPYYIDFENIDIIRQEEESSFALSGTGRIFLK